MRCTWLIWLLTLIVGFGLMLGSHFWSRRVLQEGRWAGGLMLVAEDELTEEAAGLGGRPALARFLPLGRDAETMANALGGKRPETKNMIARNWQEKVILLPEFQDAFSAEMLQSGRLPEPGRPEALAGHDARRQDKLTLADETFQIVGVLRKEESLFSRAYLVPDHAAHQSLFDTADDAVKPVLILAREEKKAIRSQLADLVSKKRFTPVGRQVRLSRGAYYLYFLGTLLLFGGGSALFIQGYGYLSGKIRHGWLGPPLREIRQRRRLFCAVHAAYFGLCLVAMLLIYEFPDVQSSLLALVSGEVRSGSGLLGIAGRAYATGNIPLAAVATLGINFVVGSFAVITLPSVVLPGAGVLVALWRAMLWGILLAPTGLHLSGTMLPHSWTLLLEGEAYVLATFFALLLPIELFRQQPGTTPGSRYGRAVLLNLQANLLILIVLAIAATYEAIEVILLMKG